MAIYKPSNFYPHLQEIDLTQENTFSCQVNTDGAMVSAARLTISSEDNILVYENLYQFVDINGNKDPIENKGFMELPMEPYKIDKSNISFGLIDETLEPVYYKYAINDDGKIIYYDEYGENGKKIGFSTREEATAAQVYDEDGITILYNQDVEDGMLNNYNRKVVIINNIDFITLHPEPELSYDVRKDYCPYNFYNVKLKDSFCFGLKFVNSSDENDVFLYPFKYLDYEKTDHGYNMKITYNTELLFDDMSKYDCYVVLLNNKDYTWDVKMYEHLFREDIDKGTLVTDGYITGSTKTVFWWDSDKQTEDTLLNRKEIKEDYFVEINATTENSDLFKEQLKLGRVSKGLLKIDNIVKEENDNIEKELLKNTREMSGEAINYGGRSGRNGVYRFIPCDRYKYTDSGQRKIKNSVRSWIYADESNGGVLGRFVSYAYRDITYSYLNIAATNKSTETQPCVVTRVSTVLTSSSWQLLQNVEVKVKTDDNGHEFFELNAEKAIINPSWVGRCMINSLNFESDIFVSNDYRWKRYCPDNTIDEEPGHPPNRLSFEVLNQDFYHYPFYFQDSATKVVVLRKSIFTDFLAYCTEGSDAYIKISQVIDFYEKNYISVTVNDVEYYAKVFTPRPYSSHFYKTFKWNSYYDYHALGVNENCLKYPSILDQYGNLRVSNNDVIYYPNNIVGEVIASEDTGDDKWIKELITTQDDISAFLHKGDYATALEIPEYLQVDGNGFFNYINTVYPIKTISQENETGTITSCDLYYKIIARDLSTNGTNNTLYQDISVESGKKYRISGIFYISGDLLDSDSLKQQIDMLSCKIFESTNNGIYTDVAISEFNNDYIYNIDKTYYYNFYYDLKVPETFKDPMLRINIKLNTINSETNLDRIIHLYNLSIIEKKTESDNVLSLCLENNSVQINDFKGDIYLRTITGADGIDYEKIYGTHEYKIKNYINYLNKIHLEDQGIEDLLIKLVKSKDYYVHYSLFLKQREKITWITNDLGFEKNINKIELENEFDVNLNDGANIEIYAGDNKNTYNSFYGVRDSDLNVDDIYVRFPGYVGLDFNNNYVNDILSFYSGISHTYKSYISSDGLTYANNPPIGVKGYFHHYTDSATNDSFQSYLIYGKGVDGRIFNNYTGGDASILPVYVKNGVEYPDIVKFLIYELDHGYEGNMCFYNINMSIVFYNGDTVVSSNSLNGNNDRAVSLRGDFIPSQQQWKFTRSYGYNPVSRNSFYVPIFDKMVITYTNIHYRMDYSSQADFYNNNNSITVSESVHIPAGSTVTYTYYFSKNVVNEGAHCKLFKVTNYDYETGEFVIAGGLSRSILNTDKYEIWKRDAELTTKDTTNNISEVTYAYTRLYPPSEDYDGVAYVGDTKILKDGIKIMNNTNSRIFIQPNVNFYSDEYNYPYLYLDNYGQRLEFPYNYMVHDDGFTIEDRTIETLDGSQWLLSYNTTSDIDITPGLTYKLYMDTCKSTPSNWFYGRNIANITMRVGEYNYIQEQLDKGYVRPVDFTDFKQTFNDITNKKIGNNCLIQCVDAYFMATYDQLSIPIKRYRYKLYDSSMNLINDSGYIYDNHISYGVRGLRNEEIYLLHFEMEDQLGYVYHYEEKIIVKYIEYNTNLIQLQLTNKESQGCVVGDFVTLVEANPPADEYGNIPEYIIAERDTYDEDGNVIKKGSIIKKGTIYFELCKQSDFINKLSLDPLADNNILVYRRNKEKLLSFVCKINLSKDQIITGTDENDHRYGFIDYSVYNNEYYDYVVILKQKDLTTDSHLGNMEYTYSESRCKTSFNGWILVDIEKDDNSNSYYVSDQVWNFKYNLESQDLTQNTSVSKWDTLGKYANVYIGQKNYISSGLTCLLGDVGTYYTYNGDTFKENFGYFEQTSESVNYDDIHNIISNEILTNNIDKYLSWKTFNNNGNPKLLKDYKGNMWIVQIMENPTVKNADNSQEQVYTISFNWVEIMDWRKYPILGKNISFDREEAANIEIMDILQPWDYSYNSEDMFYKLNKVQDDWAYNNVMSYSSPLMVSGRITLETNSMIGKLNDSYLGNSVLEDDKEFLYSMSNEDVELLYNNKGAFMSPFKTKQLNDTYDYSPNLTYLYFEQSLSYENNSIDFVCCGMKSLNGININLTDAIKTARYAFAGTSINTDEQYQIIINTNNYINTYGMLDDLQGDGTVTVRWGTLAEDPDLTTYAELYERYWDNDNIILDCKLNFNINDWISEPIIDENGNIDGISYTKKIILKSYEGTLTSVYIPKFYKDENGEIYLIELSEDFNI